MAISEYHACESRNSYPGEIVLTSFGDKVKTCQENIDISFQDSDFHNYQFLDILRGRKLNQFNGSRQLKSNKNSKIIILITSHGGENFIIFRNYFVMLSVELNLALKEMYIKGKYKELLFIIDSCEGYTLYRHIKVPNIYFISSSNIGQKAVSYSYDDILMGPTVDKFHYLLYNSLKKIHENNSYNTTLNELFGGIKEKKKFLESDVIWDNKIDRVLYVKDFFGDKNLENEKVLDATQLINLNDLDNADGDNSFLDNFIQSNKGLNEKRKKIDDEVMKIRNYHEEKYTL